MAASGVVKRHLQPSTILPYYQLSLVSAVGQTSFIGGRGRGNQVGAEKHTDTAPVEEVETGRLWYGQLRRQNRRKLTEQDRNS